MSQRRKLTAEEKRALERWAREREEPKYPGASIRIVVEDEVDDDGKVHYQTVATTISVVRPEEVPR